MRNLQLGAAFIVVMILSSCTKQSENPPQTLSRDTSKAHGTAEAKEYYTCPMHPSVISDRSGACPVCGMALVKKTKLKEAFQGEISGLRRVTLSPTQRVIANVSTTEAIRTNLTKAVDAVGVVDIAEPLQAKVTARFNGRIEKLSVNYTGARVRKGDPLFELHSPDLISAEQELILAVNAARSGPGPGKQELLEAARERLHIHFGMTHDQIEEIENRQQVNETVVFRSPISGTVISKDIQEGQYVSEAMVLYQLADLSLVWVYLDVYERDLQFVKLNNRVSMTTEAYTNETFRGTVAFIEPVVNSETRTVRVRTEFANPQGKLKPQMYVRAVIHVPTRRAISVPSSSVLYMGKRNVVWVEVSENTFEPRDVVLGVSASGSVEILSGLQEGERVVATGGFLIESESQLQQPVESAGAHHGGGPDPLPADGAREKQKGAGENKRQVHVQVDDTFSPGILRARPGEKLVIVSERHDDSRYTEEVVIKALDVRRLVVDE